jgi:hypothetical protein
MTRRYNILIAVDKESSRVAWHTAYRDWPRMMPDTPMLSVFNWIGESEVTPEQLISFEVINQNTYLIPAEPVSLVEKERLTLLTTKCNICWRWLIQLHDLSRTTSGYLPDIPIGKAGTNDRDLFEQESRRMKDMIAEEITTYHSKIWLASSQAELEILVAELVQLRHSNIQAYT